MIVVSDTTPLNYLILIAQDEILPKLFGEILAPPAVLVELQSRKAPTAIRVWSASPPAWLRIQNPSTVITAGNLDPGEAQAIALALELRADALLIDERRGSKVAAKLGLFTVGTLAVLEMAAIKRLLELSEAIAALRQTTFRGPVDLIDELLRADRIRQQGRTAERKREAD